MADDGCGVQIMYSLNILMAYLAQRPSLEGLSDADLKAGWTAPTVCRISPDVQLRSLDSGGRLATITVQMSHDTCRFVIPSILKQWPVGGAPTRALSLNGNRVAPAERWHCKGLGRKNTLTMVVER